MKDGDGELARLAGRGDRAALETLYRRYVDRVWRYGWLRTHSREAAEEIVQDTFLRVIRSVSQFDGRSTFATWLYAVTRSTAIDYAKRERRRRLHGEAAVSAVTVAYGARQDKGGSILRFVPPTAVSSSEDDERRETKEDREAVRKAVARLPGAKRDVIVLCEISGLSLRQAAEVLGWSESRVKTTLFRARRQLREMLVKEEFRQQAMNEK